jgi:hypothetical protein
MFFGAAATVSIDSVASVMPGRIGARRHRRDTPALRRQDLETLFGGGCRSISADAGSSVVMVK